MRSAFHVSGYIGGVERELRYKNDHVQKAKTKKLE